jgi:hypothetical protein
MLVGEQDEGEKDLINGNYIPFSVTQYVHGYF